MEFESKSVSQILYIRGSNVYAKREEDFTPSMVHIRNGNTSLNARKDIMDWVNYYRGYHLLYLLLYKMKLYFICNGATGDKHFGMTEGEGQFTWLKFSYLSVLVQRKTSVVYYTIDNHHMYGSSH